MMLLFWIFCDILFLNVKMYIWLKFYTVPFFVSGQTYKISKGSNNYCSHCILSDGIHFKMCNHSYLLLWVYIYTHWHGCNVAIRPCTPESNLQFQFFISLKLGGVLPNSLSLLSPSPLFKVNSVWTDNFLQKFPCGRDESVTYIREETRCRPGWMQNCCLFRQSPKPGYQKCEVHKSKGKRVVNHYC